MVIPQFPADFGADELTRITHLAAKQTCEELAAMIDCGAHAAEVREMARFNAGIFLGLLLARGLAPELATVHVDDLLEAVGVHVTPLLPVDILTQKACSTIN
jgi:hypothetical protein